jgi:hypothetical protein
MMRRGINLGLVALGLSCSAIATFVLGSGILLDTRIEWHVTRDYQANKIVTHPIRQCRYLYPTGIRENVVEADDETAGCDLLGSNRLFAVH